VIVRLSFFFVVCFLVCSCCGKTEPKIIYNEGDNIPFAWDTGRVQNRDFFELAERAVEKLLRDEELLRRKQTPVLVVGRVYDYCDDFAVPESKVKSILIEKIKASPIFKLSDGSSVDFDYILKTQVTCATYVSKTQGEVTTYQLALKLYDLEGLEVSSWSEFIRQHIHDKEWK
jgi:hypothetical protein